VDRVFFTSPECVKFCIAKNPTSNSVFAYSPGSPGRGQHLPHGLGIARLCDLPIEWARTADDSPAIENVSVGKLRALGACPDSLWGRYCRGIMVGIAGRNRRNPASTRLYHAPLSCSSSYRRRCGQTPPLGQLQKVVDGTDNSPFTAYFLEAATQELTKPSRLFDLPEHRLG
jgi:hypothetical protein